jgi:hypothetical protein
MSKQPWHFGTPERDPAELAEESAQRRAEQALENWARQPLSRNPLASRSPAGAEASETSVAAPWPHLLERALANRRRLRTPGRQRAAFLRQLERCTSVVEAAARADINRATLYRWKADLPAFAEKWARAIRRQAEDVSDNIVLRANHGGARPVFQHGRRIGEPQRSNDRLQIHLQNRLDAERRRAEDRVERRALAELKARPLDAAALAEHLLELMDKRAEARRQSASRDETPDDG